MDKQFKCNIFVFNLLLYIQYVFHVYYFVHVYMVTAKSEAADHARVYLHSLNTHPFPYTYQSIHPSINQWPPDPCALSDCADLTHNINTRR